MALIAAFPCQKPPSQITCSINRVGLVANVGTPTPRRINLHKSRGIEVLNKYILGTESIRKCAGNNQKRLNLIATLAANSDSGSEEISSTTDPSSEEITPSGVIMKFYTCINDKNLQNLPDLVSEDCELEDSSFLCKLQGKKEVVGFFSQLAESMGENVQFRIRHVFQGDELTASLDWHLEWKEDQLPSSRGCSIFQFSKEEDRLVVRKAQIITESPVKPGRLAVAFLKILISLFDEFPKAAKWFLKSPHTILNAALKVYSIFVAPFMNPVIAFYLNFWKFIVQLLGYFISFFHFGARFFGQNIKKSPKDDDLGFPKSE